MKRCEKEPKLFYKYINGKMTETITKLIKGNMMYEISEEMSELMNESFKSVFNEEGEFIKPINPAAQKGLTC